MDNSNIIFGIKVHKYSVQEADDLCKTLTPALEKIVTTGSEDLAPPFSWLCPSLTTSFGNNKLNDRLFSSNQHLAHALYRAFASLVDLSTVNLEICHTWFNYYRDEQFQEWHAHLGDQQHYDFSFVYFLSFDSENHAKLLFKDPLHLVRDQTQEQKVYGYSSIWSPSVSQGDLLIFPPYLEHCVKSSGRAHLASKPRITVSGNARVRYDH